MQVYWIVSFISVYFYKTRTSQFLGASLNQSDGRDSSNAFVHNFCGNFLEIVFVEKIQQFHLDFTGGGRTGELKEA